MPANSPIPGQILSLPHIEWAKIQIAHESDKSFVDSDIPVAYRSNAKSELAGNGDAR